MEKKAIIGIINVRGWSLHFNYTNGRMQVETGTPRKPTDAERTAISDFVTIFTVALNILAERVDMTEAMEAKGITDPADLLIHENEKEDFKNFVKSFAEEISKKNEATSRMDDKESEFDEVLRRIFEKDN